MTKVIEEIEKSFKEVDEVIGALYQEATDQTNDWKNNSDNEVKQGVDERMEYLFGLNKEKKLLYGFYDLKKMLVKIVSGLPDLINEKGEMNEKSLNLLTNVSAAVEKLEKEQKKQAAIPVGKNSSYTLMSSSEKERLESELAKERAKNDELKKRIDSLEAAEKNKKKQQQQTMNEIETELVDYSDDFLNGLSEEGLVEILKNCGKWKDLLNGTNGFRRVKEISSRAKLNLKRLEVKKLIANALVDWWADLKGKRTVVIDKEELLKPEYRNYSETLDEMDDLNEINIFKIKILQAIARQRNEYRALNEGLLLGKRALESRNPEQVAEARKYLLKYHELQMEQEADSKDYSILLKKWIEFNSMSLKLLALEIELEEEIENQEGMIAQTTQHPK